MAAANNEFSTLMATRCTLPRRRASPAIQRVSERARAANHAMPRSPASSVLPRPRLIPKNSTPMAKMSRTPMRPPESTMLDPAVGLAVDSGPDDAAEGGIVGVAPVPAEGLLGGALSVGAGASGVTTAPDDVVDGVPDGFELVAAGAGVVGAEEGGDDARPPFAARGVAAAAGGAAAAGEVAGDGGDVAAGVVGPVVVPVVAVVGVGAGGWVEVVVGVLVVVGGGGDPLVGTLDPDDPDPDGGVGDVAGGGAGGAVGLKSSSWPVLSTAAHDNAAEHEIAFRCPNRSSRVGADHPVPWNVR